MLRLLRPVLVTSTSRVFPEDPCGAVTVPISRIVAAWAEITLRQNTVAVTQKRRFMLTPPMRLRLNYAPLNAVKFQFYRAPRVRRQRSLLRLHSYPPKRCKD